MVRRTLVRGCPPAVAGPGLPIVALLLTVALPAVAAAQDRPAIPLRQPPIETPLEAAGTGLAPEATVRIRIDPHGRVQTLRLLKIEPASSLDATFERAIRETVQGWRYAPEIHDGTPIASEVQWTIQFVPRDVPLDEPDGTPTSLQVWGDGQERRSDPWREILRLPTERRSRMLNDYATRAEAHLDLDRRQRIESRRFVVYTDAPLAVGQSLAVDLEHAYDAVERLLAPAIVVQPQPDRVLVFLFAHQPAFDALTREVARMEWASGFYNPAGLIALHREVSTREGLAGLILHEATHAFVDRHVIRPGTFLPRWLLEGIAEYVANSAIREGVLVPGRSPRSRLYGAFWKQGGGRVAFDRDEILRALRTDDAPTVERLFSADRRVFYGDQRVTYYTMSWLLVHFLRHGRESWAENEFPDFMLYVAEGYPVKEAFRSVYGTTPAAIEDEFRRYVGTF